MKIIQIEANKDDNNEILRAAGVKKIHGGWYTVHYNGAALDKSTVVKANRNIRGEIKVDGLSKNWRGEKVSFQ